MAFYLGLCVTTHFILMYVIISVTTTQEPEVAATEATGSRSIGTVVIALLSTILLLIVILDAITLPQHLVLMRNNLQI